jgi:transcriptional regulator GlxA family with amidase domain
LTHIVGIYLFDDVEVLDFAGPFEVFSTAARVKSRLQPDAPRAFEVFTLADAIRTIRTRGDLMVQPRFDITNHPRLDVLIIPGGIVTDELNRKVIIDWIAHSAAAATITAAVCTGAFLLGKAGLLQGKDVTTHWEDIPALRSMFPDSHVQSDTRWSDTGQIITSAGISAGIDMSLHLVARLESVELALRTARQMEYDWQSLEAK